MNILITGGLGYVGGRIADYLNKKSPASKIFLTTSKKDRRLPSWADKFTVLHMNLLDEESIAACLGNKHIDVIIHLAAMNEIDSMKDPELAMEVNTNGTHKLLNLANNNNICKFIYFSTFHVYGKVSDSVIGEDTPTRPFHPYAITHRAAEGFVDYFQHYHNMGTLIFRLSNGYGYPMDEYVNRWPLVFNDICRQAVTTGKIVLRSSGKQYRDFISLHDIARAVYHFLFVIPDSWGDGLYNLGGECAMSILDVAKKISKIYWKGSGKALEKIEANPAKGTPENFKPFKYSIDKMKNTGFSLMNNMVYEIENTLNLCQEFSFSQALESRPR